VSFLRRWAPWIVLVVVAAVALAIGVHRSGGPLSVDAETAHLASEVRCPVCQGETAEQSSAPASVQIRNQIRAELVAGESPGHILSGLEAAYGQGILEKPPARGVGLLVWLVPVVAVVVAVVGLGLAFARWRPRRGGAVPVSDGDREAVERALRGG
jgi:cytochrome c-type biogenesis protein CcmH